MKTVQIDTTVFGENCKLELMTFDEIDRKNWKTLFNSWKSLKLGMREYKSREPNFPEGLSEVAYCLWSGSSRFIKAWNLSNTSFDTFNQTARTAEQIKACSIEEDLTSFGPRSKWDRLIFLDFYNNGKVDGRFDIYEIPTDVLYNYQINRTQTFKQQQAQGRRPRLSLKKIASELNIKPLATNVQVWRD